MLPSMLSSSMPLSMLLRPLKTRVDRYFMPPIKHLDFIASLADCRVVGCLAALRQAAPSTFNPGNTQFFTTDSCPISSPSPDPPVIFVTAHLSTRYTFLSPALFHHPFSADFFIFQTLLLTPCLTSYFEDRNARNFSRRLFSRSFPPHHPPYKHTHTHIYSPYSPTNSHSLNILNILVNSISRNLGAFDLQ
jgi:hypothetical protein